MDGSRGEPGREGLIGLQGPKGAQGFTGLTGSTGSPGLIGLPVEKHTIHIQCVHPKLEHRDMRFQFFLRIVLHVTLGKRKITNFLRKTLFLRIK